VCHLVTTTLFPTPSLLISSSTIAILSRTVMNSLPAETIDRIIDHLGDPYYYRSAARVCRKWLPRSRFRLFQNLDLYPHSKRYYRSAKPHPCGRLYAVIQQTPHISSLIAELHIHEGQDWREQDWVNTTPALISVLDSLTHLRMLHLRRFNFESLTSQSIFRLFKSNPITSLDLELCGFPLALLTYLSHVCPTLKLLTVRSPSASDTEYVYEDIVESIRQAPRRLCQLDDLRLVEGSEMKAVLWQIMDKDLGFDLSCLRTLHCRNNRSFKILLDRLAPCIHHLLLTAPEEYLCMSSSRFLSTFCMSKSYYPAAPEGEEYVFGLEEHTGLRTLQLTCVRIGERPSWEDEYQIPTPIEWLKTILSSVLGAPHLKNVAIEIYISGGVTSETRWNVLKVIDDMFDGNQFPLLDEVEIRVEYGQSTLAWGAIQDAVGGVFPILTRRKLLVLK
jgi:hypothetical protein